MKHCQMLQCMTIQLELKKYNYPENLCDIRVCVTQHNYMTIFVKKYLIYSEC